MTLDYELTKPKAIAPRRATDGSAGYDLTTPRDLDIRHEKTIRVNLGIKVRIPAGHVGLLTLRSNLGSVGAAIPNGIGIIDSDYRGELALTLTALGDRDIYVDAGVRIAQLVIVPIVTPEPTPAKISEHETERGGGGFGSTGNRAGDWDNSHDNWGEDYDQGDRD